jgi:hypothetical protein
MVVPNNDARHVGLTLTLLVLIALALVGCGSPTIATINGDTISGDAFAERFKYDTYLWTLGLGEQALQDRRAAGQIVLETMIDEQITYQKSQEAGITASDVAILAHRAEVLAKTR